MLLLIVMPGFLFYGQLAMADVPALSLSLVVVALAVGAAPGSRARYVVAGCVSAVSE